MSIGDINSTERGSGARYNNGKIPYELIPVRILADSYSRFHNNADSKILTALLFIAVWQEGGSIDALHEAAAILDGDSFGNAAWDECAQVFEYGKKKYAEWNWLKGMPWSVPLACAVRHLLKMAKGEMIDPESGLPHRGHVLCNLAMLIMYARVYPEGDDRPEYLLKNCKPEPPPSRLVKEYQEKPGYGKVCF